MRNDGRKILHAFPLAPVVADLVRDHNDGIGLVLRRFLESAEGVFDTAVAALHQLLLNANDAGVLEPIDASVCIEVHCGDLLVLLQSGVVERRRLRDLVVHRHGDIYYQGDIVTLDVDDRLFDRLRSFGRCDFEHETRIQRVGVPTGETIVAVELAAFEGAFVRRAVAERVRKPRALLVVVRIELGLVRDDHRRDSGSVLFCDPGQMLTLFDRIGRIRRKSGESERQREGSSSDGAEQHRDSLQVVT